MLTDSTLEALLKQYFPCLDEKQHTQLQALQARYVEENKRQNLISRTDMLAFAEHHLLHALVATRCFSLCPKGRVLDLGAGSGLPSLPLAICFPQTHFCLVDSKEKKLHAAERLAKAIGLKNISCWHTRIEHMAVASPYDMALGRAVAPLSRFLGWIRRHKRRHGHPLAHLLCYWCPQENLSPRLASGGQWHAFGPHYPSLSWFATKGLLAMPL